MVCDADNSRPLDNELLLKIYQPDYYSPHFLDERKRLDRLDLTDILYQSDREYNSV